MVIFLLFVFLCCFDVYKVKKLRFRLLKSKECLNLHIAFTITKRQGMMALLLNSKKTFWPFISDSFIRCANECRNARWLASTVKTDRGNVTGLRDI